MHDCPEVFPFLGFSCNPSNTRAGWEGDSVSVSCGCGEFSVSGGRIPPQFFGHAAARNPELGSGAAIH